MKTNNVAWRNPNLIAPITEIKLDYEFLEQKSCLVYDEVQRDRLAWIAQTYVATRNHGGLLPVNRIKKMLASIGDAATILEKAFEDYSRGVDGEATEAVRSIYPDKDLFGWIDPGSMAAFLGHIALQARKNCKSAVPPGRRNDALMKTLVKDLHGVFSKSGGSGRGCSADGTSETYYSGHFYSLVCAFVEQIDGHVMAPSGVGKLICSMYASDGKEKSRKK